MPKKSYRRLRADDRPIIYRMRKAGKSQREIAHWLGFSQSNISKELSRNRGLRGYRPVQAHSKALERHRGKRRRHRVIVGELQALVRERLECKQCPEQISGALRREGQAAPSRTSIYTFIQADRARGGTLYRHLRINGKRRYRHKNKASRHKLPARVDIELRPAIVQRRERYGDWEADLIAGCRGGGYVLSLYERKSRYGRLALLQSKDANETAEAIIAALQGYRVHTITYDNGLEFAGHLRVSETLGAVGFFCKPYHSWEKGGVENFNGRVRQYFPKGTNFLDVGEPRLAHIETQLNQRPRKTLHFLSPNNLKLNVAA